MIRTLTSVATLSVGWLLVGLSSPAGADLGLDWHTIDGGGHTFSTGGAFELGSTCGQPDAGEMSGGSFELAGGFWHGGLGLSAVRDDDAELGLPSGLRITAGLVNPFHHETHVDFELPTADQVEVLVFDHTGRLQRGLYADVLPAGYHRLTWDGLGDSGRPAAAGVYWLRVRVGKQEVKRSVVLLR